MANIMGLQQQQEALKEITDIIKELKVANKFLDMSDPETEYSIGFIDEEGKKMKIEISGYKSEIDELVNRYKEAKRNKILTLAQENRIALDPEDNEVLGIEG